MKIINPSNVIDIWTKLEDLRRINLNAQTKIQTEASKVFDNFHKRAEIQNEQQYRNALGFFQTKQMEKPGKLLRQHAFNRRLKMEKHMLIVLDKSTSEENLPQSLQIINIQFKLAVTFLTGSKVNFFVTGTNVFFSTSSSDDDFILFTNPAGA